MVESGQRLIKASCAPQAIASSGIATHVGPRDTAGLQTWLQTAVTTRKCGLDPAGSECMYGNCAERLRKALRGFPVLYTGTGTGTGTSTGGAGPESQTRTAQPSKRPSAGTGVRGGGRGRGGAGPERGG